MGRVLGSIVLLVVIVFGIAWAFGFVNLQQTRDAQLPTVSVKGGQMPKFDADVANVDADVANVQVGTKTETVEVPRVDVGTTQKNVEVPSVSVDKPAK